MMTVIVTVISVVITTTTTTILIMNITMTIVRWWFVLDRHRKDLHLWEPRVKKGGIIAGHDFTVRPHAQCICLRTSTPWAMITC